MSGREQEECNKAPAPSARKHCKHQMQGNRNHQPPVSACMPTQHSTAQQYPPGEPRLVLPCGLPHGQAGGGLCHSRGSKPQHNVSQHLTVRLRLMKNTQYSTAAAATAAADMHSSSEQHPTHGTFSRQARHKSPELLSLVLHHTQSVIWQHQAALPVWRTRLLC